MWAGELSNVRRVGLLASMGCASRLSVPLPSGHTYASGQPLDTDLITRTVAGQDDASTGRAAVGKEADCARLIAQHLPLRRLQLQVQALRELALSLGREGRAGIESLTAVTARDFRVDITEKNVWGLAYKDIAVHDNPVRDPDKRGYDERFTSPHVEDAAGLFEKILASMLDIAAFESKLKRLGDEILKTTRRTRVMEERVLPDLHHQIKTIAHYLSERERESYYRLKRFKEWRQAHGN